MPWPVYQVGECWVEEAHRSGNADTHGGGWAVWQQTGARDGERRLIGVVQLRWHADDLMRVVTERGLR